MRLFRHAIIAAMLLMFPLSGVFGQSSTTSDYKPSVGPGLVVNIQSGTTFCNGAAITYSGGSVTLTDNSNNYIYLDGTNACSPSTSTSSFPSTSVPLATAITHGGIIVSFRDVRGKVVGSVGSTGGGGGSGVLSINGVTGAFTFTGSGVSCASGTCTFTGATAISLTTTGTGGAATLSNGTLNIPTYQCGLTLTTTGSSGAATLSGCTLNIPQYTASNLTNFSDSGGIGSYAGAGGFTVPNGPVAIGSPSSTVKSSIPSGAFGFACAESSTAGVPAAGVDYLRCDSATHKIVESLNGGAEVAIGSGGSGTTTSALTFNSTGGASPGATFNGSNPATIDYHTVGASAAIPNATAETANWTAACNTPYVGNAASGITATLPTIATGCVVPIQNINTGAVTVSSGSANIYQGTTTGASSISIAQGTTVTLWTDGSNWYATKPAAGGGGSQTIGLAPASTPSFSPAAGTYSSTQSVTISCTYGTPYYVVGASLPGTAPVTQYSSAVSVSSSETLQAGCFGTAYTPTFASAAYTISLPQAATPTFSPAAGTYSSTQTVTISDSTSGATIYYTTDGSTPTTSSTVYSTGISVASTETIKAIATASGYSQSAVGSASYTISGSSHNMNVIQTTTCGSTSTFASTATCTFGAALTAGNSVLVGCAMAAGASAVDISTTPTSISVPTFAVADNPTVAGAFHVISNVSGGGTSITITYNNGQSVSSCAAAEVSGLVLSSPTDGSAGFVTGQTTGNTGTGSITTTNANDAVIGIVVYPSAAGYSTFSVGSGWNTLASSTVASDSQGTAILMIYKNESAAGAYNPAITQPSGAYRPDLGTVGLKLQ